MPPPEPDPPEEPGDEQLADLLEACLRAERALPGSAARIIKPRPKNCGPTSSTAVLGQRLWSIQPGELGPAARHGLRVRIISRIAPRFWPPFSRGSVRTRVSWALEALSAPPSALAETPRRPGPTPCRTKSPRGVRASRGAADSPPGGRPTRAALSRPAACPTGAAEVARRRPPDAVPLSPARAPGRPSGRGAALSRPGGVRPTQCRA